MSMRDRHPSKSGTRNAVPDWVPDVCKDVPAIIDDETQSELLVLRAKLIGEKIKSDVTTSQVRNIFGPVRQIQLRWRGNTSQDEAEKAFRQVMLLRLRCPPMSRPRNGQNKRNSYARFWQARPAKCTSAGVWYDRL